MKKLTAIANQMKTQAATTGQSRRALEKGLTLTLRYTAETWILSLTRQGVWPSDQEGRICRRAFDVPDEAGEYRTQQESYRIIRYSWTEAKQLEMPLKTVASSYEE